MQVPSIRIIDNSFEPHGYISNYESLQFERRLWEIGNFTLQVNLQNQSAAELKEGRIIILGNNKAGFITGIDDVDGKKGTVRKATGQQLKGIVAQRITVPGQLADTQYYGYDRYPGAEDPDEPSESVIKYYISTHMVNPENAARQFPNLIIAPDQLRGLVMRWSSRFEGLDAVLKGIGEYSQMGYDILPDLSSDCFVFDVIPLRDRTAGSENPIVFSTAFGNVEDVRYSASIKNWANAGYVGGAGEDEDRLIQTVYEDDTPVTGWDRRETWLDCGNIDLVDDLLFEGKHKLKDKKKTEGISGTVLDTGPFVYLRDWDIGDLVTVQSKHLGVTADLQITGVKETYEKGKTELSVTFGDRPKTILDTIRKAEVIR